MAKTKANEREFTGQVISWMKRRLDEGGLPFENAMNDPSLYGPETTKFPDVLLTLDFAGKDPFCGWELKTPTTNARDKVLLKKAVEKAQTIESKYFVTWNMQTAIIWRTPEKTRAIVNENDKVREIGPDHRITSVDAIRDREKAQILEDTCRRLLLDLARLHENERINLPATDTTVFVGMVSAASKKMAATLFDDLKKARANRKFDKRLNAWAKKQGISKYDQEYYLTLAQQMAYKIIGKLLFYITLRKQNLNLPRLDLHADNYHTVIKNMRSLFQLALEVDYQAIFESDITDEIELSQDSAGVIIELSDSLAHWSFELMHLDVIGNVFEKLIPEDARHTLGQYFTPDNLVDLITALCVKNGNDLVMDPTCGTGTFLIGAYRRLRSLGLKRAPHNKLLEQIWGFDIAGFPAELATINLCRQNLSDYRNFPRVLAKDFFDVQPGTKFEFPPPKKTAKTGDRITVTIPKFDALVGNFPFIRQELIEKEEKGYKKKLEEVLFENWGKGYPTLFRDGKGKDGHKLQLSGQADIFAYLFFHSAAHLKPTGRMGFVTSNSWLDVAYGYELQKFFLSKFKLIGIFESRCEPWFEQSAVNTVFTILERCEDEEERNKNDVRFVKVKKPLPQLFPQDSTTDAQSRSIAIERFVDKIEEIDTRCYSEHAKNFKKFPSIDEKYVKEPEIISYEDDEVRVRLIRQADLYTQILDAKETVKWGQYLRGPDIYFEILEKCADKLVPLRKVAEIRRGFTTGINKFFYLRDDQINHWGIEEEFLKPVLKSPKEFEGILIDHAKLTTKVFLCKMSKEELRSERKTRALKYIQWGEKQKTKDGVPWPDVPTVRNRKPGWWTLPEADLVQVFWTKSYDVKHLQRFSPDGLLADQRLYQVIQKNKVDAKTLAGLLNCSLFSLSTELGGRVNLGDGALDTTVEEAQDYLIVPDVTQLTNNQAKEILQAFDALLTRSIKAIFEEVKMPDRQKLDRLVLKALGLDPKKYLKPLYDSLSELVGERLLLPKLRGTKKKRRVEQDLGKLKEDVTDEILPNEVRKFPEAFVQARQKTEWEEISVAAKVLRLGEMGIGIQEIVDGQGQHVMELRSPAKAKYIVYAKKKNEQIIKVPKGEIVIKKAILDYEIYVRDIKNKLYTAFMEKCGNHNMSLNLAKKVCDEFGLPDIR